MSAHLSVVDEDMIHTECIIEHWFRNVMDKHMQFISITNVSSLIAEYCKIGRRIAFSTIFKSDHGLKLTENNECVEKISQLSHGYTAWILADIKPVSSGVHCWRVAMDNPKRDYIIIGVSAQKRFGNESYNETDYLWGYAGYTNAWYAAHAGRSYTHGKCQFSDVMSISTTPFVKENVVIDVYLDCDRHELKICLIESMHQFLPYDKQIELISTYKVDTVDKTDADACFVPHFNIHRDATGLTLRVWQISPWWYRKKLTSNY
mmetsp:Transcript_31515/g.51028  ORF Transcript_31515/g.51028 Transcript_31515/m.51028 type:complete len:262 (-) Transcript_31515:64-849(-)|eukprot:CAMPEP_0202698432 /NCGR_PEP_ID=MMETSP1385-20130828/11722_1 /ASSEMBLY_ACC=CAM_ASM_000861 /TAXON_ID=933848 /ORGANISM="Elphidium margaritaceum" /LENGTH=261 /DNA_ID=CAMNT_0049355153 /DNA_START=15 /DNA_END=800 /DNA_ORIENTATION=-